MPPAWGGCSSMSCWIKQENMISQAFAPSRTGPLSYALQSVPGVSEVASIGGFEKQYQVIVDPDRLHAYKLSLMNVIDAIKRNNNEAGGRLIEWSGKEFMVRAKGYVRGEEDLRKIVIKASNGTPGTAGKRRDHHAGPADTARSGRAQRSGRRGGRHRGHASRRKRAERH